MRGIVNPDEMLRFVDFDRLPAGDALEGLVEWFWTVSWDLPEGVVHDQEVLNHPAGNISIGTLDDSGERLDPAQGRVYGVQQGLSQRRLTGAGWTVAARTTVGGLGVFLDGPARKAADSQLSFADGLPGSTGASAHGAVADTAVAEVVLHQTNADRVAALRRHLEAVVATRDAAMVEEARRIADVAALAETDRSVCRVEQLAEAAGYSVRSLQRLFDQHVGQSPAFIIRRWRIIEAAEAARLAFVDGERWRGWAAVADELGYSDQAHLVRDFRRHLGVTPAAYVARNRS